MAQSTPMTTRSPFHAEAIPRTVELYARNWRSQLHLLLSSAAIDVLIACPFVKEAEARWACDVLAAGRRGSAPRLRVLTDLRSDSVLSGGLDIGALRLFCESLRDSTVISLPRLHCKVYVADTKAAIVTSGNLTPSGLEGNFEYGVGLKDEVLVAKVRSDFESDARVGSPLTPRVLEELEHLTFELKCRYEEVQRSSAAPLRRQFKRVLAKADFEFLKTQVGTRSAHSLFTEAVLYVLSSRGPMETRNLAPEVQRLLPNLCDDSTELVINGERFGKRWKHDLRNAQQALKRAGLIVFDGVRWGLRGEARA